MIIQKYSVTDVPIQSLFAWLKSEEIVFPWIQRPFVWNSVQVRQLLDSLYHGYTIGYFISWRNPNVKLKKGGMSSGKRIIIDGQQRIIALLASILGEEIINKNFFKKRIRIAFDPINEKFEVTNDVIENDASWIADISNVFASDFKFIQFVEDYCKKNTKADKDKVFENIQKLVSLVNNPIGLIELESDLTIEEVTEIFKRINKQGTELSQADFAMSTIASNENYDGYNLRKAIEYFCHMAINPEFFDQIKNNDIDFAKTDYFAQMAWLKNERDDIYDPSYTDMLRVAFTYQFKRGRLQDLVALLSGRNFETKDYEEAIAEKSFGVLKGGILNFMNETDFKRFVMIIRSAGFITPSLIGSQNTLNFAYIIYLTLRAQSKAPEFIEQAVRRWFVMSILTRRYSGSPESKFDYDIKQIDVQGFERYADAVIGAELSDSFWDVLLPQNMNTSSAISPFFKVYQAAHVKMNDNGFLSKDIKVTDLLLNRTDVHHIFPKDYLKKAGMARGRYNQIANYALAQSEINIKIGNKAPSDYFNMIFEQCNGTNKGIGAISDMDDLKKNLEMHCIPEGIEKMTIGDYDGFLENRRKLMAQKIKEYFAKL